MLALATSGDRKLLATAGRFGDVRVYQMTNRQRLALIPRVPAPVYAVALDGKGTRLAPGQQERHCANLLPAGGQAGQIVDSRSRFPCRCEMSISVFRFSAILAEGTVNAYLNKRVASVPFQRTRSQEETPFSLHTPRPVGRSGWGEYANQCTKGLYETGGVRPP